MVELCCRLPAMHTLTQEDTMDINTTTLVGRLAADPSLTKSPDDDSRDRCWFRLAVNGRSDNAADFIPVTAWGALARAVAVHCRKGKEVAVMGRLHSYIRKVGDADVFTLEVNASSVSFGGDPKEKAPVESAPAKKAEEAPSEAELQKMLALLTKALS